MTIIPTEITRDAPIYRPIIISAIDRLFQNSPFLVNQKAVKTCLSCVKLRAVNVKAIISQGCQIQFPFQDNICIVPPIQQSQRYLLLLIKKLSLSFQIMYILLLNSNYKCHFDALKCCMTCSSLKGQRRVFPCEIKINKHLTVLKDTVHVSYNLSISVLTERKTTNKTGYEHCHLTLHLPLERSTLE